MFILLQQQLKSWKQTWRLTTPSCTLGCVPLSQPVTLVPQRYLGTQNSGIVAPALAEKRYHLVDRSRSHLLCNLLPVNIVRSASSRRVYLLHCATEKKKGFFDKNYLTKISELYIYRLGISFVLTLCWTLGYSFYYRCCPCFLCVIYKIGQDI